MRVGSALDPLGLVAVAVVLAFGGFLIGLAAVLVFRPTAGERFLRSFAGSARAHYLEQGIRLIVGVALVVGSRGTGYPDLFRGFGWLIIASTVVLLLTPWRWHHRFAVRVMPAVCRNLRLFALGAFVLGAFVLFAAMRAGD